MATLEFDLLGVGEFVAALEAMDARVDAACGATVRDAARVIQRQARTNATGRPGPKVRTGTLRRSITIRYPKRGGGGVWEAQIGPTAVYSRRVELGFDGTDSIGRTYHQPPYPYFAPAWRFGTTVAVHRIWRDSVAAAMGV
jgi:Bacteriophage HK97-gp10, putative tail-component